MNIKIIGSILMILGTSIGAGMLALPIVTAYESLNITLLMLFLAWALMTIGAFSILEANLWLAPNTNLISMANFTLGKWGKLITWLICLLLLYSLLCAYLSGLSDITQELLTYIHVNIPRWSATIISLLIFGVIVYCGLGIVDMVNRGFMSVKLIVYFVLVVLIAKHIQISNVLVGDYQWRASAFMVMLTSFGYANIIPSLRVYLKSDKKALIRVIFIGSLLPLVIYAIWIFIIQGLISKSGANGLISMITSSASNSDLMQAINMKLNISWLSNLANLFISICAVTSFLGVSICLVDFIADGVAIPKTSNKGWMVYALTYLPPLIIVLAFPGVFIKALSYAGICCLLLLIVLPLMMLYTGRYYKNKQNDVILPGGRLLIILALIAGLILVLTNVIK